MGFIPRGGEIKLIIVAGILEGIHMADKITATDAARRFSEVLNQVRYQGAEFDIVRGKEVVARLVPAAPAGGVALDRLDELARASTHAS